ncbi:antibiotic biosynthesis monooxygenase [Rhodospirillaceae bacterium KN72]|uniref:Antibiotic biosynthesis monooxygenase n=1 Tax=Pacificispira spongiicola TaxID=2729598 RepID=A0A7Y0HFV5_9PROT|nr:putative quinol monooxygenase [Pacificispira spongiicola]NMM44287.1 antibiotic biosynthesis monooxygenase [Pacificispira spongiicola]
MPAYADPTAANLNNGFVVAINIVAKDGEAEAVAEILENLIEPTMAEEGVKFFMPYRSPSDPNAFFIYELYIDEAGWDAHNNSSHFKSAIEELLPRVAARERVPFVPFVT